LSSDLPGWALVLILFGVYLFIQAIFNLVKLRLPKDSVGHLQMAFASTIVSYVWLISATLVFWLALGYKVRVDIPPLYPDIPVIVLALLICFIVMLVDFYFRMVVKRRLGGQIIVDAEEIFFLFPTTIGAWELAFFNLAILKPFAFELFVRGVVLPAGQDLLAEFHIIVANILAILIACVVEFFLKPNTQRIFTTFFVSFLLSVVYLASAGGVVSSLVVRLSASVLLSMYLMHLVIKASKEETLTKESEKK